MPITGKQRSQRIFRGYHALPDAHLAWKRWLGMAGLILGLAYSGWLLSKPGQRQISTGPLSQSHSAWNHSGCEQCHVPFNSIRHDSLWGSHAETLRVNNSACNGNCHKVTGHFESRTKQETLDSESCSRCHQEHLGLHRSLLDIPDSDCARCHTSLADVSNRQDASHSVANNFSTEHPKFSIESLPEDPGTILFSHIQHMRPGQPKTPGDGTEKKLANLPSAYRAQYASRVDADDRIQLNCSDCHERDVALPGYEGLESLTAKVNSGLAMQSTSHRLYKPVEFEKHCVACHALDGIPHGRDRKQTLEAVNQQLPADLFEFFKQRGTDQPPSESVIRERELRLQAFANSKTEGCMKCHTPADDDSPSLVQPSRIPTRWLQGASFTHGAHLMVACIECHAEPYAVSNATVDSRQESNRIMIRGLEQCRTCHIQNPEQRASSFANNQHVASADCIDCHRYHVDPPISGSGITQSGDSAATATPLMQWVTATGPKP